MKSYAVSRRQAFSALAAFVANSPLLYPQQDPFRDHSRVPGLKEMQTPFDFEGVAYAKLPRLAYDYPAYGEGSEFTLRRNREAFEWVELLPRRLGVFEKPDTSVEIFGQKLAFPMIVSPTAGHQQLFSEGEMATHVGAAAANTTMIVSNNSSFPFDKIAAAAQTPLWAQLYPKNTLDANRSYLDAVQAAGSKAIVVTIDQQASTYERAQHDRNLGNVNAANAARRGAAGRGGGPPAGGNPYRVSGNRLWYEWKFFDEIRPLVKGPILAKGVLTAEDAKLCLEHGVDGIYVSNHGGRSLDYGPSTLEVLPEIVDAVRGRVPVLFDSGIRRGTDVVKALALGANAVCMGRIPLWGLSAYGPLGVQRILEMMQAEVVQAMRFAGAADVKSLTRKTVLTKFQ